MTSAGRQQEPDERHTNAVASSVLQHKLTGQIVVALQLIAVLDQKTDQQIGIFGLFAVCPPGEARRKREKNNKTNKIKKVPTQQRRQ